VNVNDLFKMQINEECPKLKLTRVMGLVSDRNAERGHIIETSLLQVIRQQKNVS
jgi:hypothetical protein